MPTQTLKIKCPHCGWLIRREFDVEIGEVDVIRGDEAPRPLKTKHSLEDANTWLPVTCPNPPCGKTYEYNKYNGKVRP